MSRIGKVPVLIPSSVTCSVAGNIFSVQGPNGSLKLDLLSCISAVIDNGKVLLSIVSPSKLASKLYGTYRSVIKNMIDGVTDGFSIKLELKGVGYKASVSAEKLILNLGYSHPIEYAIPKEIKIVCGTPTEIVVSGIDKIVVGQVVSEIRSFRKVCPYKGKGVLLAGQRVILKEGKKK